MCHPGGSRVLRWLTKFSWPRAAEISPWHTKTGLFLGFWADAASDRSAALQLLFRTFLQGKTHQNMAKQAAKDMYKHGQATNGTLNEVAASVRRPFVTVWRW
ncbi:unnamed protein product [Musa textilis]